MARALRASRRQALVTGVMAVAVTGVAAWGDEPQNYSDCGVTAERTPQVPSPEPMIGAHTLCQAPCAFPSACWWGIRNEHGPTGSGTCTNLNLLDQLFTGWAAPDPATGVPTCGTSGNLFPAGFRLNLSLFASPSPGDFLPVSSNLGADTLCLVPAEAAGRSSEWNGASRANLDGVVDLVTGVPLIRTTDLELPLDGAVFRLTRTRSGHHDRQLGAPWRCTITPWICGPDRWWDWVGVGWMASENPILLVDSAIADVVGNNPRTCYLMLDAHRSIPFQLIESHGTYEAPPRFRARLKHNGTWMPACRRWAVRPTRYEAFIYDGAIKYTFDVYYEDVPAKRWNSAYLGSPEQPPDPVADLYEPCGCTSGSAACDAARPLATMHSRPILPRPPGDPDSNAILAAHSPWRWADNPGFGVPYYALCSSIEDRTGHSVVIEYCDSGRGSLDLTGPNGTADCVECGQDCLAKGQIRRVQIKTNGVVKWTLLYIHRRVWDRDCSEPPWLAQAIAETPAALSHARDLFGHSVIDRIYVYEGDPLLPEGCGSIRADDRVTSGPEVDWIDHESPVERLGVGTPYLIPNDWRHQVRYHYLRDQGTGPEDPERGLVASPPLLVKTSVESRPATGVSAAASAMSTKVFVYQKPAGANKYRSDRDMRITWLRATLDDSQIERALSAAAANEVITVNNLACWRFPGDGSPQPWHEELLRHAGVDMLPCAYSHWSVDGSADSPAATGIIEDCRLSVPREQLSHDGNEGTVGTFSMRSGNSVRHYRIHRMVAYPRAISTVGSDPFNLNFELGAAEGAPYEIPRRSAFAHPYLWQAHYQQVFGSVSNPADSELSNLDLSKPRWISIIDEFATRDAMSEGSYGNGAGSRHSVKPGQLSRRVVQINPAGYVLRDQSWQFKPATDGEEASSSGSGLGEEFVYRTASEVLPQFETVFPAPPGAGSPAEAAMRDPFAGAKRELLLVEHRSVGWSAAEHPLEDGLVRFFEYELRSLPPLDVGEPARPLVVLEAEGVRRGAVSINGSLPAGGDGNVTRKSWTRQYFREDSAAPEAVTCEVEYLRPPPMKRTSAPGYFAEDIQSTAQPIKATWYQTVRAAASGPDAVPANELPVRRRIVIGSPRQQRPEPESPWYYPVQREDYDDNGGTDWSANGLVSGGNLAILLSGGSGWNEDPLESITHTRYIRDPETGRPLATVLDSPLSGSVTPDYGTEQPTIWVGDAPEATWPLISGALPLGYVTSYRYDHHGLSDILFPNKRRWARRIVIVDPNPAERGDEFAREFVFNDLETNAVLAAAGVFETRSAGEVREYASEKPMGAPVKKLTVEYTDPVISLSFDALHEPEYEVKRQIGYGFDANGRVAKATMLERGPDGALLEVGSKEVNDLGEVVREREVDGTIMRRTRDALGRTLRTYVGTKDRGWLEPLPGEERDEYNMALIERTEYGSGEKDAWLPTIVRRYVRNPDWHLDHHGAPPLIDADGIATWTRYDWRMRPVRVDSFAPGDPTEGELGPERLSTTFTYLDHADRPEMVVTYGRGVPTAVLKLVDPCDRDLYEERPPVRRFLEIATEPAHRPTSITVNRYSGDGSLLERRIYDMAWPLAASGDPPFQAEIKRYGRGGTEVFSRGPGRPVQITRLDSLGRTSATITVAPRNSSNSVVAYAYEVARTDSLYDADGNLIETARWERTALDGDVLTTANAVRTRSVSWYDAQKRLVASAELGTEQAAGFIAGPAQYVRDAAPRLLGDPTPTGIDRAGLPAAAQLSITKYNKVGQREYVSAANGSVTRFEYDAAGRMRTKIENFVQFGPSGQIVQNGPARRTKYGYELGRLVSITAEPFASGGISQQTRVVYFRTSEPEIPVPPAPELPQAEAAILGESVINTEFVDLGPCGAPRVGAEVVDDEFNIVSANGSLAQGMIFPGEPGCLSIKLRYNFAGQVAERIDARGLVFRYSYDALGRLVSVQSGYYASEPSVGSPGDFVYKYPNWMTPAAGSPADRASRVEYQYDDAGRLSDVIALSEGGDVVAHTRSEFDARGHLISETQSIGELATVESPRVEYQWSYAHSDPALPAAVGHDRLTACIYPQHDLTVPTPGRTLAYGYGAAGSLDDAMSRVASIATDTLNVPLAEFGHPGLSRRSGMMLAGGRISARFDVTSATGLPGLDSFGRLADLHYQNSVGATLFRAQYTYDVSGNRMSARLTQAASAGISRDNVHSQVNRYDALDRLIGADVGVLETTSEGVPSILAAGRVRQDSWTLDRLGNWNGGAAPDAAVAPEEYGRRSTGNLDGRGTPWERAWADDAQDESFVRQVTDDRNRIREVHSLGEAAAPASPAAPGAVSSMFYDPVGNLIFDGNYVYQYDAWNRVVQVNAGAVIAGIAPPTNFSQWNGVTPPHVAVGHLLKHYTYDGLGRLIRTQSPHPDAAAESGIVRVERFYYDGVRRIQEVVFDPLITVETGTEVEDPEVNNAANQAMLQQLDPNAGTLPLEQAQQNSGEIVRWVSREYVWGPGDGWGGGGAGVDELLVQFDRFGTPWWVLTDAGGDCVAVCDLALPAGSSVLVNPAAPPTGPPTPPEPGASPGRVCAQFVYDAYGELLAVDHLRLHAYMRCGHKGLFFDRLDVGVLVQASTGTTSTLSEPPRLVPFAHLIGHNRNRVYAPGLGRFLQADPNATAAPLLESMGYQGVAVAAAISGFDLDQLYGDGGSLYGYLGSNPYGRSDPLGLEWVEDYADVLLPMVPLDDLMGMLSVLIPFDPVNTLEGMLDKFDFIRKTQLYIQDLAFDAEEDLDWALSWVASDDDNPRSQAQHTTTPRYYEAISGLSLLQRFPAGGWGPRVKLGRAAETAAQRTFGGVRCKRMVQGKLENGANFRRFHDLKGAEGRSREHAMEVKGGSQGLTHRVRRQIHKDRLLMEQQKVKSVRWKFMKRANDKIEEELLTELGNNGIEYEIVPWNGK